MKRPSTEESNILVVEDDQHYRTYLCRALSREGYNVRGTANGRDGIAVGTRFRPQVLVVNWTLGGDIDGLGVAKVLQAVEENLQSILITGYSLSDVAGVVTKPSLFRILEKPFELLELVDAVREATLSQRPPEEGASIALIEVDQGGAVVSSNSMARSLLGLTRGGPDASSLSDLFSPETVPDLDLASRRWVTVTSNTKQPIEWQVRTQPSPLPWSSRLVVVAHPQEMTPETLHLVDMLLEDRQPSPRLDGEQVG